MARHLRQQRQHACAAIAVCYYRHRSVHNVHIQERSIAFFGRPKAMAQARAQCVCRGSMGLWKK